MKVGDLVRLQFQGNGQPSTGMIYEVDASGTSSMPLLRSGKNTYKCLWDMPSWNNTTWHEDELAVINESR
jgi:hypothetical protein